MFLYSLIGLFRAKKPYFSKEKYMLFSETDMDLASSVLLNMLSSEIQWYDLINGEKLTQVSKEEFKAINKDYKSVNILKEWVEWR
jgi:hypothetical protein